MAVATFAAFFACVGNGRAQDVDNVEGIVTGLRNQDPDVQLSTLAALDRQLAFGGQQSDFNADTLSALQSLLFSGQPEVSQEAARILMIYAGDKPETAEWLIDKARATAKADDGAIYISLMLSSDMAEQVRGELMYIAMGPTDERAVAAVEVLLGLAEPPDELLAEIVRHAQHPLFYGRQSLIRGVAQYAEAALPYLPVLTQIRDKLISESLLPYEQRTVNVHRVDGGINVRDDTGALTALNEVIDYLAMLSQEPQD
jgi:hypothetical protein